MEDRAERQVKRPRPEARPVRRAVSVVEAARRARRALPDRGEVRAMRPAERAAAVEWAVRPADSEARRAQQVLAAVPQATGAPAEPEAAEAPPASVERSTVAVVWPVSAARPWKRASC